MKTQSVLKQSSHHGYSYHGDMASTTHHSIDKSQCSCRGFLGCDAM